MNVERSGTELGLRWWVAIRPMGFRVGYVEIPPAHPWCGLEPDEVDVDVHGGLTFLDEHEDLPGAPMVAGFDCLHAGDGQDPDLMDPENLELWQQMRDMLGFSPLDGIVRDADYVEHECRMLAAQVQQVPPK